MRTASWPAPRSVFDTTAKVAEFYKTVLGRSSVDNKGFDLVSSLHYAKSYNNAFWNGSQMVYDNGDGKLFGEMYLSPDVIGHELTHGVTQNLSALRYEGEWGALNESISDVFGTTAGRPGATPSRSGTTPAPTVRCAATPRSASSRR